MESKRVHVARRQLHRKDSRNGIIRSVGFDYGTEIWGIMSENRGRNKGIFQEIKRINTFLVEDERGIFTGKASQGNSDIRVSRYKPTIEIGEAEERLNIPNTLRLRPILNRLDFLLIHRETLGRNYVAEVLDRRRVELALFGFAIKLVLMKAPKDFFDMLLMIFGIGREDEDVVQVDDDKDVEDVGKDVVHEVLKGGWSIGETEGHDQGLEGSITSSECSFPNIVSGDPHEVVARPKIELGEDLRRVETV